MDWNDSKRCWCSSEVSFKVYIVQCLPASILQILKFYVFIQLLALRVSNTTKAEFANAVDPDEMAHYEPSHLNLQCLPTGLWIFNMIQYELKDFLKNCRRNTIVCFLGPLNASFVMNLWYEQQVTLSLVSTWVQQSLLMVTLKWRHFYFINMGNIVTRFCYKF